MTELAKSSDAIPVDCPECGGWGDSDAAEFGDRGRHPCFRCGTTGTVTVDLMEWLRENAATARAIRQAALRHHRIDAAPVRSVQSEEALSGGPLF